MICMGIRKRNVTCRLAARTFGVQTAMSVLQVGLRGGNDEAVTFRYDNDEAVKFRDDNGEAVKLRDGNDGTV